MKKKKCGIAVFDTIKPTSMFTIKKIILPIRLSSKQTLREKCLLSIYLSRVMPKMIPVPDILFWFKRTQGIYCSICAKQNKVELTCPDLYNLVLYMLNC
jgi:hypothetical protein